MRRGHDKKAMYADRQDEGGRPGAGIEAFRRSGNTLWRVGFHYAV